MSTQYQKSNSTIQPIRNRMKIDVDDFIFESLKRFKEGATDAEISEWLTNLQPDDLPVKERLQLTEQQLQLLREDAEQAFSEGRLELVDRLQEWYKLNPHLPQPNRALLYKFIWRCKGNEAKCKKILAAYYTLRATDVEIFGNRDPTLPEMMEFQKSCYIATLPILTPELYRVTFSHIVDPDPDKFCVKQFARRFLDLAEVRIKTDFCLGDVVVYDFVNFTTSHLLKFTPSVLKRLIVSTEGALPTRIKQIHMVNCPTWIDKLTNLIRPFLREKIAKRIQIHTDSYDELHKSIPKHLLPIEFGGTLGTVAEFNDRWTAELVNHKDWFISEEKRLKRIYLEAKNSGKNISDSAELFGMEGSFKKLDID